MKRAAHSRIPGFLSHLLYFFSIFVFIIAFGFQHNPPAGWYQQFLPDLNGASLTDITFTDSLTGYAVTKKNSAGNAYILKTFNGGDNWSIIRTDVREFSKVQFLNSDTGYAGTLFSSLTSRSVLFKTTNGGVSWDSIGRPNSDFIFEDFWVLNTDSIWATYYGVFGGGIYRTVNGGQSWENQYYAFGNNPHRIYMFNGRMGFMYNEKDSLFKTTNSGTNWFRVPGGAFTDIYFIDTLTGWKANGFLKKTSNGGISWVDQNLPSPPIGNDVDKSFDNFDNVYEDTIWGVGGRIFYNGVGFRPFIYKTTNDGANWGYQLPDTGYRFTSLSKIQFVTDSIGWSYSKINKGIHTTTAGLDTTIIVEVESNDDNLPKKFILNQNFPNPFNPVTTISYELTFNSYIELTVFDFLGKEIQKLVNGKQNAGSYDISFNGSSLSSGVYLYSLKVNGETIDTKKMVLIR